MKKVLVIIGAVLLVLVLALVVVVRVRTGSEYQSRVQSDWAKLNDDLARLDSSIVANQSFDFGNTAKDAETLRRLFDERVIYYKSMTPPSGSKLFHEYFLDYLARASTSLAAVSKNCSTWSESETANMRSADSALCDSARNCATAWNGKRALLYKADLFQNVPGVFNQMHEARRSSGSSTSPVARPSAVQAEPVHVSSDGYMLPGSSSRDLNDGEITCLTQSQLRIARNEIYARHGLVFRTDMSQYFASKNWYRPRYTNVDSQLSSIEKRNIERIRRFEH